MIRSNCNNIEILMKNSMKNSNLLSLSENDGFNIDSVLPITNESELKAFEDNLKVDEFKSAIV